MQVHNQRGCTRLFVTIRTVWGRAPTCTMALHQNTRSQRWNDSHKFIMPQALFLVAMATTGTKALYETMHREWKRNRFRPNGVLYMYMCVHVRTHCMYHALMQLYIRIQQAHQCVLVCERVAHIRSFTDLHSLQGVPYSTQTQQVCLYSITLPVTLHACMTVYIMHVSSPLEAQY